MKHLGLAGGILLFAALLQACSSAPSRGGYYQDDGPQAAPSDITVISDAVVKNEPLSRSGNEPYQVFGKTYIPLKTTEGYHERGVASWYGKKYHGKRTSNGEKYDMFSMSAAHKTLPLPSYVRVRNLQNGRSVIVRVNDRGPFLENRLIDLSYAAAIKLGIAPAGTGLVEVEAVTSNAPASTLVSVPTHTVHVSTTNPANNTMAVVPPNPQIFVQMGAFNSWTNAEKLRARLEHADFKPIHIYSNAQDRAKLYRVRVGPLPSIAASDEIIQRAHASGISGAIIAIE